MITIFFFRTIYVLFILDIMINNRLAFHSDTTTFMSYADNTTADKTTREKPYKSTREQFTRLSLTDK